MTKRQEAGEAEERASRRANRLDEREERIPGRRATHRLL
jgi:hypothetical protein